MNNPLTPARRPRSLAQELVNALGDRIRDGRWKQGEKLPTEAAIMEEFGVSRTVVREAMSRLQAAGAVQTRHGIGTFVVGLGEGGGFHIGQDQLTTLRDVVAVLELRLGIESEAAALAAQRRTDDNLERMRSALAAFGERVEEGRDAVGADFQLHLEIARATQNPHFVDVLSAMGTTSIPRARLEPDRPIDPAAQAERRQYLLGVHAEHEALVAAIGQQDVEAARAAMRLHLSNSRERRKRMAQAADGRDALKL